MIDRIKSWFSGSNSRTIRLSDNRSDYGDSFYPINLSGYTFGEGNSSVYLHDAYGLNPYVSMVVGKRAEKVADLPFKFVDAKGEPIENSITESFIDYLNQGEGFKTLMQKLSLNLDVTGNFFLSKITPVGFNATESELNVLHIPDVDILTKNGLEWGEVVGYTATNSGVGLAKFQPDEVVHGKLPNIIFRTNWGLSKLMAQRPVFQASNNEFMAEAALHENMGADGIITRKNSEGSIPMSPKEQQQIQDAYNRVGAGAKNFGKIIATNASMEYIQFAMDATKMKTLELNAKNLRIVCAAYSLDSKLFGDDAASTFNNLQEAKMNAMEDAYIPQFNLIASFLSKGILNTDFNLPGATMCVDESKIKMLNKRDYESESKKVANIISVQNQIAEGKIDKDTGVNILVYVCGMGEEEANNVLNDNILNNEGQET